MSRKRKLYVSELLNRNTNKDLRVTIITKFGYQYFDSVESCLNQKDFIDNQVKEWYISHSTLTQTLFIKI